jgi:hypothetical protein
VQVGDVKDAGHGGRHDIAVRSGSDDEIGEMRRDAGRERR